MESQCKRQDFEEGSSSWNNLYAIWNLDKYYRGSPDPRNWDAVLQRNQGSNWACPNRERSNASRVVGKPLRKRLNMSIVKNVACPVCGTLCDDLEITVDGNRVIDTKNTCAVSEAKLLNFSDPKHRNLKPLIRRDGELVEVSWDEAIKRSAQILAEARYPILYGWSCTNCRV